MNDEAKPLSREELWDMVMTFSQHAENLKDLVRAEQGKNRELQTENSGWLDVYQNLLSQIGELRAEILHLELRLREYQGGS